MQAYNLTKTIDDHGRQVTLLKDISFTVNQGELVAINGPSGSGKSSLLYLLGLLDTPDSGEIIIKGQTTQHLTPLEQAEFRLNHLGYIFQFHFLLAEFTSLYNVMIPLLKRGVKDEHSCKERALDLLCQLGLEDKAYLLPSQLSGGQRQRVAIARSLANDPPLILADEPTGSLDSRNAQRVFDIFRTLCSQGQKTIIMVTHDTNFASQADRRISLEDGQLKLAAKGSVANF